MRYLLPLLLILGLSGATANVNDANTNAAVSVSSRPAIDYDCQPCLDRGKTTLKAIYLADPQHREMAPQIRSTMQEAARSLQVNLEVRVATSEEEMVQLIEEEAAAYEQQKRIGGLLVSLPSPAVAATVQMTLVTTQHQLPIWGFLQGYQRSTELQSASSAWMGHFAMEDFALGQKVGQWLRSRNEYWKRDGKTTPTRRVVFLSPDVPDPHQDHVHQVQERLRGLQQGLARHTNNVTIEDVTMAQLLAAHSSIAQILCSFYDALVVSHNWILPSILSHLDSDCNVIVATFGTNQQVYDAMASERVQFTTSSDYYLPVTMVTTLAGLYATTGMALLPQTYGVSPRIIHFNNLPRDPLQICEDLGYPSCQKGNPIDAPGSTLYSDLCDCQDRSLIRIAAVYERNEVFELQIAGARQAADDLGIDLQLDPLQLTGFAADKEQQLVSYIESLCNGHYDGVIAIIRNPAIANATKTCRDLKVPVMGMTPVIPQAPEIMGKPFPVVGLDDYQAGYAIGKELLAKGMKVGFCVNWKRSTQLLPRCEGFQAAIEEHTNTLLQEMPNDATFMLPSYHGVIFGKSENRGVLKTLLEHVIGPRLAEIDYSTHADDSWHGVGLMLTGHMFLTGAVYTQQSHPGLLLGTVEQNEAVYEALEEHKLVATVATQVYLKGYLTVALSTWMAQTKQKLSTNFVPTGPLLLHTPPVEEEKTCAEQHFEPCPANMDKHHLQPYIRAVCYTILALILLFAIYSVVWVHWNYNERVVRASQPFFLVAICLGCVVMASTIVPLSIDDGVLEENGGCVGCECEGCNAACMASPWLFALGFNLVFASLFSKIWRMNRLVNGAAQFRRLQLSAIDVIKPLVVLLTLNIIFLMGWTILDPMYWNRHSRCGMDLSSSYGICEIGKGSLSRAMACALLAVNFCAVVMANYQAYKARNFSTDYSESKYIALAMVCIFQISMVGIPLMFLVTDSPTALFFVQTGIIAIVCGSVLLLLFLPKMWLLRQVKAKRAAKEEAKRNNPHNRSTESNRNAEDGDQSDGNSTVASASTRRLGLRIRQRNVTFSKMKRRVSGFALNRTIYSTGLSRNQSKESISSNQDPSPPEVGNNLDYPELNPPSPTESIAFPTNFEMVDEREDDKLQSELDVDLE